MNTVYFIVGLLTTLAGGCSSLGITSPAVYAFCQTGCNAAAVACYAGAGAVFGLALVPACSVAQGACMAACAAMTIAAP